MTPSIVFAWVTGVLMIFVAITSACFFYLSRKSQKLILRSWRLMAVQVVNTFITLGMFIGMLAVPSGQYPCFIMWWTFNLCMTVFLANLVTRSLRLIQMMSASRAKLHMKRNYRQSQAALLRTAVGTFGDELNPHPSVAAMAQNQDMVPTPGGCGPGKAISVVTEDTTAGTGPSASAMLLDRTPSVESGLPRKSNTPGCTLSDVCGLVAAFRRWAGATLLRSWFTGRGGVLWLTAPPHLLFVLYILMIQITDQDLSLDPINYSCPINWPYMISFGWLAVHIYIVFPFLAVLLWGIEDAYGIFSDLIIASLAMGAGFFMYILWLFPLNHLKREFPSIVWLIMAVVIIHTTSVVLPTITVLRSQRPISFAGPPLLPTAETYFYQRYSSPHWREFIGVLASPQGLARLRQLSTKCLNSELIIFLEEYQELKELVATVYPIPSPTTFPSPPSTLESYTGMAPSPASREPARLPILQQLGWAKTGGRRWSFRIAAGAMGTGLAGSPGDYARDNSLPLTPVLQDVAPYAPIPTQTEGMMGIYVNFAETWRLYVPAAQSAMAAAHSTTSTSAGRLSSSGHRHSSGCVMDLYPIRDHSFLCLSYQMFYQRFVAKGSALSVALPREVVDTVEELLLRGDYSLDMFDPVWCVILRDVYTKIYFETTITRPASLRSSTFWVTGSRWKWRRTRSPTYPGDESVFH
ncbi:hypothetical protein IWQ60_007138 [Tieghemiomyces parasiticus]|uniref:RGS domain-containing protein n=1 Tax=Tieghemiomyces parasiticus TaxID=78921 RepID=A0A9W8DQ21_9FUNG|nr:hypothetical protein IWQ60_007138 [Tieghemiomyces parasiticus]